MLKNKDGTPYRLNSPNPLVKDQVWDDLVLHNWEWEYIPKNTPSEKLLEKPPELEPIIVPEPKIPEPEIKITEPDIPITASLKGDRKLVKNLVVAHCLPKEGSGYGKKFSFEAVILKRADFNIVFWTPIKLELGSIIYPSVKVDGNISYGDYQWWKIDKVESKKQGYLISGMISDVQPDFS